MTNKLLGDMVKRGNNNMKIMIGLLLVLVLLGVWCLWNKSSPKKENQDTQPAPLAQPEESPVLSNDVEMLELESPSDEEIQLIENYNEDESEDIMNAGFGSGPGLYGSGRAWNEFFGA